MRKFSVLLVEAHGASRAGMRLLLQDDGYHVVEAATGKEALAAGDVDVVVADTRLPDMTSSALLDSLDWSGSLRAVVVVTGLPEFTALSGRPNVFLLAKPLDIAALELVIGHTWSVAMTGRCDRNHPTDESDRPRRAGTPVAGQSFYRRELV